jgi:hypothetical protein
MSTAATLLFIAHAFLEFGLGAIKLRGTYAGLQTCGTEAAAISDVPAPPCMPPEAAKFARHHGICILALGLLGGECARRQLVQTEFGKLTALVLGFFHAGCTLVMVQAINLKVVAMHAPFAIGFLWHALAAREHRA